MLGPIGTRSQQLPESPSGSTPEPVPPKAKATWEASSDIGAPVGYPFCSSGITPRLLGIPPHCVYTAAPHCQAKLTLLVSVAKVAVQGTPPSMVAALPEGMSAPRVYSRPDRKVEPSWQAGTVVSQALPVKTVVGVTKPGTKVTMASGILTRMLLKLTLWPVTRTVMLSLAAVAAAQMVPVVSGTSLLLNQRQSSLGTVRSMNRCGSVDVVGV